MTLASLASCGCRCHSEDAADAAWHRHEGRYDLAFQFRLRGHREFRGVPVDASDAGVLAAAVACGRCLHAHCPALLTRGCARDGAVSGPRPIRELGDADGSGGE